MSIDTLLVLGGSKKSMDRRANTANNYLAAIDNSPNLITSGYDSQAQYLAQNIHIDAEMFSFEEEKAQDTYTNMVFSYPMLQALKAKNVGLVTDGFHMKRSSRLAKLVFDDSIRITELPTSYDPLFLKPKENLLLNIFEDSLRGFGTQPGDLESHLCFLDSKHPFYGQRSDSVYKKLTKLVLDDTWHKVIPRNHTFPTA